MSKKGFNATINTARRDDPPMSLKDHIFYGLQLDEEQLTLGMRFILKIMM